MKLELFPVTLNLKERFTIAHDSRTQQRSLIVGINHNGQTGYGEATVNKFYHITMDDMVASLQDVESFLNHYSFGTPEKLWEDVFEKFKGNMFALCALDEAAHDLYGKLKGQPTRRIWKLSEPTILSNYTIGIASKDDMVRKVREFPWPIYKVKLGTDEDIEIIQAIRDITPSNIRIDANCAWTADETIQKSMALAKMGVEFIEQPMHPDHIGEMAQVKADSALPLIADEDCLIESDVEKCADKFHGINIKLMKCGGLTPALRMIAKARELDLRVMVGCMNESSVGISAIAQLTPLIDYVDMDGILLISNDVAEGVKMVDGKIIFPNRNGNGVLLFDDIKSL